MIGSRAICGYGSVAVLSALIGLISLAPAQTPPAAQAQAPRKLPPDDERRVEALNKTIDDLRRQGKFAEARDLARDRAMLLEKALGSDDWRTADAGQEVQTLATIAALPEEGRVVMAAAALSKAQADALDARAQHRDAEVIWRRLADDSRRWLGEDHFYTATSYNSLATNLGAQGRYAEAEPLLRKSLDIRLKALGESHLDTATGYNNLATNLNDQGRYAEAEPLHRKAMDIYLKTLGESHFNTAVGYNNLAHNLASQGRNDEAEPLFRKSLNVRIKAFGEGHPNTARGYTNLGMNLNAQGRYAAADSLLRKGLDIRLKALGQEHRDSAEAYNNLAYNLDHQGRYAEAEPLFRKALDIRLKALGQDHPETAEGYNNLATNLNSQGRYTEAESLHRKALDIYLKALGEGQRETAHGYSNLATDLNSQGRYTEAEPLYRKALGIYLKALGESHSDTARGYNNLAAILRAQGRYAEAEPLYRKALDIRLKSLGQRHSATAQSNNNLATILNFQGRYTDAEPFHRKALDIYSEALGEDHPETVQGYNNLAYNLDAQGRTLEAIVAWEAAARGFQRSLHGLASSGVARAQATKISPLSPLTIALARQGHPRQAWTCWEAGLGRGVLDDLSARSLRPLTPDQRDREGNLLERLQAIDEQIGKLAGKTSRNKNDDRRLEQLRHDRSAAEGLYVEFARDLEVQHGAFVGKPAELKDVQAAIPIDTALVGWVDVRPPGTLSSHHWVCVVRRESEPVWVKIAGTGPDQAWVKTDDERTAALRAALVGNNPDWRELAARVAVQRIGPLRDHLAGIRRLVVLPSPDLAGVPVEALLVAWDNAPDVPVSYVPSGTMLATLSKPRPDGRGPPRLLALGDPAFPPAESDKPLPSPPTHGIAILAVASNGPADLAGIKGGDVLLEYNSTALKTASDLKTVPAEAGPTRIPVKFWRNGEMRSIEVAAGKLGINHNPGRTAAEIVLAWREASAILKPMIRGDAWEPLPGTRREVGAIAGLFPKEQVTTLLGRQANEPALQELATTGALKQYRFIHLATHGRADATIAMNSALFLSPDSDDSTDPLSVLDTDGRITAQQIAYTWNLDAELVVLSACQTGLGRAAGGEGYLGFAQALFAKGARSVVLSLWEVDDKATSLLMSRFYQNLLGCREGLTKPLAKAVALAEAKSWLRGLTEEKVGVAVEALSRGAARPLGAAVDTAPAPQSSSAAAVKPPPFAHPYYWAAFVLIGDSD